MEFEIGKRYTIEDLAKMMQEAKEVFLSIPIRAGIIISEERFNDLYKFIFEEEFKGEYTEDEAVKLAIGIGDYLCDNDRFLDEVDEVVEEAISRIE